MERTLLPSPATVPALARAVAFLVGASLVVPVVGYAATLGVAGGRGLGAGAAAVSPCDTSFAHSYTTVSGNVSSVEVTGIADPACEGGQLSLTLTDATGSSVAGGGPVAVPTDPDTADNAVTVPVSPAAAAEVVSGIRISVTGS